jgi:hypothetical protein
MLSPATNSSCHRRCRLDGASIRLDRFRHRQLDTSNGCQDHTVLPYASAPFVCVGRSLTGNPPCDCLPRRRCRVHRILIPRSRRRTTAPLAGIGWDISTTDLGYSRRGLFSQNGIDRFLLICPSGQFAASGAATSSLRTNGPRECVLCSHVTPITAPAV